MPKGQAGILPVPIDEIVGGGIVDMTRFHHDVAVRLRGIGQRFAGIEMACEEKASELAPKPVEAVQALPGVITSYSIHYTKLYDSIFRNH